MGLYMNENEHPHIYKNLGKLLSTNQVSYHTDGLLELIQEQQALNHAFHQIINGIKKEQTLFSYEQTQKWGEWEQFLEEFKALHSHQEKLQQQVIEISQSHEEILKLLNQFEIVNQEIVQRLDHVAKVNDDVMERLDQVGEAHEEMMVKMEEQHTLKETMTSMEESQKELVHRMDMHEGLLEKIIRHIDQVRFSLFERTNFLEEKIEKYYHSTIELFKKFTTEQMKK